MTNEKVTDVPYVRRHLVFGWASVLAFLTLGVVLEALHGFKIGWLLDVSNETRRTMLGLSHAHGTLLGLINVAYAATLWILRPPEAAWQSLASTCLISGTVLLPGGFFLGGLIFWGGDPGLGILLVPMGAVLLLVGVFLALQASRKTQT
jgi:hypothetical protein